MVTEWMRTLLARCYVALAEIDHDLWEWRKAIGG